MRCRAAIFLLLCAACSSPAKDLDRAHDQVLAKDYAGALASYRAVLRDLGRDESSDAQACRATAMKAMGDLCDLQLADPVQAVQRYRELAERYPTRPETFEARVRLSELLRDQFHDQRAALAQLEALVQSFPSHLDTDRYQYRAAQDYFELRDYPQTETELKLFLTRYPGSGLRVEAQMLLANALELEGRKPEAIAAFEKVAEERPGPDAARALVEIGRIHEDSGEWSEAESCFARALPNHPQPKAVALALERVKQRVARSRPVDVHDHNAIFDHVAGRAAAEGGD